VQQWLQQKEHEMRTLMFALVAVAIPTLADAYELRCQAYYDYWNRGSYSRCQPWFSEEELYRQRQSNTINDLDRSSGNGARRPAQAACQAALEAGVSADVTKSYGCAE